MPFILKSFKVSGQCSAEVSNLLVYINHHRRQWTWMSPGDRTRNKIDYILIQNRFRNSIKSSKSMLGADCDSDHAPVLCKLLVKLRKLKNHNCKLNSTS